MLIRAGASPGKKIREQEKRRAVFAARLFYCGTSMCSRLRRRVLAGTIGQAFVLPDVGERPKSTRRKGMKQLPIYIATLAAVAAIGMPASQAADAQSGIIVAQATSPGDANHPGSQPAFATQGQPEQSSAAQQQPAQPAAQQQRQSTAPTAARRAQPATTGSGSQQR
jgi:hypothetical protein